MGSAARSAVLWGVAALAAGGVALGAGAVGLLGNPVAHDEFASPVVAPLEGTALLDCPAGAQVGIAPRNERLYVIARSPDAAWLAVRSVVEGYRTVWLPAESVEADQYPIRVDELPELACEVP